jgi:hypothetical protein
MSFFTWLSLPLTRLSESLVREKEREGKARERERKSKRDRGKARETDRARERERILSSNPSSNTIPRE